MSRQGITLDHIGLPDLVSYWSFPHSARLPLEVTELIIDWIGNMLIGRARRATLYSCACTCLAWYPRSRYHLLRSIFIRNRKDVELLMRLCNGPSFTPSLRAFTEMYIRDAPKPRYIHSAPQALCRVAPFVQTLRLDLRAHGAAAKPLALHHDFFLHLSRFSTLRRLEILNLHVQFGTLGDVTHLISVLPALAELILQNVRWKRVGMGHVRSIYLKKPILEELHYAGDDFEPLLEWLLRTPSARSIKHFSFDDFRRIGEASKLDYTSLQNLLDSLKVSLLVLSLNVAIEAISIINLSRLTHIQVMHMQYTPGPVRSPLPVISSMLDKLSGTSLCELTLQLYERNLLPETQYDPPEDASTTNTVEPGSAALEQAWKDIDKTLTADKFCSLASVVIKCYEQRIDGRVVHQKGFHRKLPLLYKSGVLRTIYIPYP